MRIIRWAIIMPITMNKFEKAEDYTVAKRTVEDCNANGGIQLKSKDNIDGNVCNGYKTTKIYRCRDRIPTLIKWALPKGITRLQEKCISTFPKRIYEYIIPDYENTLRMKLTSVTEPYKFGDKVKDGGHDLYYLDIVNWKLDKGLKVGEFSCKDAGIEKLPKETNNSKNKVPTWVKNYNGPMTITYKTLEVDCHIFGAGSTVESLIGNTIFPNIFAETHKEMILWAPEWSKMNNQKVSEYEEESYQNVNNIIEQNNCQ